MRSVLTKSLLICSFSFFLGLSFGQDSIPLPDYCPTLAKSQKQEEIIYEYLDEPASFPGGASALRVFLADNLVFSEEMIGDGSKRKYYVKFIVDKDGTCRNFTIVKVINECLGCDKEVLRVLQLMPKWKPGLVEGKPVSSWFRLPVTYGLQ